MSKNYSINEKAVNFKGTKEKIIEKTFEKGVLPMSTTFALAMGVKGLSTDKKVTAPNTKVENYLSRFEKANGNMDEIAEINEELGGEKETPEIRALRKAANRCIALQTPKTEQIRTFYQKELDKVVKEENAKKAALDSLNPNAKLDENFFKEAFINMKKDFPKAYYTEFMNSNAGLVENMMSYKNADGSQMFTPASIADVFVNCEDVIKRDPGRVIVTLESDAFKKSSEGSKNIAYHLFRSL